MFRTIKLAVPVAALTGLLAAAAVPASADDFTNNVSKAQGTLTKMDQLLDSIEARKGGSSAAANQVTSTPRMNRITGPAANAPARGGARRAPTTATPRRAARPAAPAAPKKPKP